MSWAWEGAQVGTSTVTMCLFSDGMRYPVGLERIGSGMKRASAGREKQMCWQRDKSWPDRRVALTSRRYREREASEVLVWVDLF